MIAELIVSLGVIAPLWFLWALSMFLRWRKAHRQNY